MQAQLQEVVMADGTRLRQVLQLKNAELTRQRRELRRLKKSLSSEALKGRLADLMWSVAISIACWGCPIKIGSAWKSYYTATRPILRGTCGFRL